MPKEKLFEEVPFKSNKPLKPLKVEEDDYVEDNTESKDDADIDTSIEASESQAIAKHDRKASEVQSIVNELESLQKAQLKRLKEINAKPKIALKLAAKPAKPVKSTLPVKKTKVAPKPKAIVKITKVDDDVEVEVPKKVVAHKVKSEPVKASGAPEPKEVILDIPKAEKPDMSNPFGKSWRGGELIVKVDKIPTFTNEKEKLDARHRTIVNWGS